jgi:hypothetical protein
MVSYEDKIFGSSNSHRRCSPGYYKEIESTIRLAANSVRLDTIVSYPSELNICGSHPLSKRLDGALVGHLLQENVVFIGISIVLTLENNQYHL